MEGEKTFLNTFNILEELGIDNASACDCAIVGHVCTVVSTRAANLCGAAIAVLINRIKKPKVTVGVDGSVYRFHPTFSRNLEIVVSRLIDPGLQFEMKLSEDGSGRGAALVAAVAHRLRKEGIS
ncbi:unnamed protein product [Soboliphyme baturini]|uniref:Phosphotransferase n=1 Tax=Soboliphyme baturini TaxID=241478 RepID=A0A183IL37_9BILA|nr:unnamed protein product [Soboliphyme baturini]